MESKTQNYNYLQTYHNLPGKSAAKLKSNENYIKFKKIQEAIAFLYATNNQFDNIIKADTIINSKKYIYIASKIILK